MVRLFESNPTAYGVMVFGGMAVVIALLIRYYLWSNHWEKARLRRVKEQSQGVADVARAKGLEFVGMVYSSKAQDFVMHRLAKDITSYGLMRQLRVFEPFGDYPKEEVRRLMVGPHGESALFCCDYVYYTARNEGDREIYNPDESTKKACGVVGAQMPVSLPSMTIEPEATLSRLGQSLGLRDMKVELDEFNRRYFVRCEDVRRGYEVLTPAMIEMLMSFPPMRWQIHESRVIVTLPGGLNAEFTAAALDAVAGFTERIPGYVRSDFSAPRPNV